MFLVALGALAPGRYAGEARAGRVWVELAPDGQATFGGAAYRWRLEGEVLHLDGAEPLRLKIEPGPCLVGPPFGRVCLTPAPLPAPPMPPAPARPAMWVGAWQHRATGGVLDLELGAEGAYRMVQRALGDAPVFTEGRWQGDASTLTLTPTGGAPLQYRVRRVGPDLLLGGGDLPLDVRFGPRSPESP